MSYVKLLDSHSEAGSVRWDGRPVKPSPSIFSLPEALVDRIKELTQVRKVLVVRSDTCQRWTKNEGRNLNL